MEYTQLRSGILIRRYKRFLADVRLASGEEVVAHCPNTGSMRAVNVPGSRVWLSPSRNPARKLAWTWEWIELPMPGAPPALASIHTGRANDWVEEALGAGRIAELAGYTTLKREAKVEGARLDFRLASAGQTTHVEVKQVTLREEDGHGYFPDAVSERGRRHLESLATRVALGERAVLLFCVAHTGIDAVAPAAHLDPAYADTLRRVAAQGVEVLAYGVSVTRDMEGMPGQAILTRRLRVDLERQPPSACVNVTRE
ncbi:sugar fermentation stimulation protein [Chromohalobacter marismortui]|uniref:Sugar fermentation stimulation protein homolog n=1 Tax=Chromohalobacter marismortui TaxID=42055 RepID=A0A4R7NF99_9GAMM|nr:MULTISPECIES: DNA/RNA nuclease SfsA [Chromohalobacter]MCI0510092.1 DNA/RNA nuclease SfsA [Chromohalobacter sp.]MCI0593731.1 DNA/RNA nuclease SfsA [Chromohalobacter sp.]TDU18939.1 sugar fermentation stimulation protein [Chromohalobacter marismortui]